jgi:uncharacterized protein YbbC (DUF1343 family)
MIQRPIPATHDRAMTMMHPVITRLLPLAALASALGCATSTQAVRMPADVAAARSAGGVVPGVEVLLGDSIHLLRGKRVGLVTNHSARDRAGASTADLLHRAAGVQLVALFGPEHGIRGAAKAGEHVGNMTDSATGLPVYSLYGETRAPTPAMLANVDVLVYDIQDVGARIYTYPWTMALAAEAAGKLGKEFIVLDRPNPIRADVVEGGVLDTAYRSFVGQYPVAMRYGFTPGELMRYLVGTGQVTAKVTVVPMRNYRRAMWWDDTGLAWVNPSPNLRTLDATLLYPGTVFFEGVNATEGRGTDKPFQLIGASWLTDAGAIARSLNAMRLGGVRFDSTSRTIEKGYKFGGETIPMVDVVVTDRNAVHPVEVGVRLLRAIYERHPREWKWNTSSIDRLSGSDRLRTAVEAGTVDALLRDWDAATAGWAAEARRYWIY